MRWSLYFSITGSLVDFQQNEKWKASRAYCFISSNNQVCNSVCFFFTYSKKLQFVLYFYRFFIPYLHSW